jgi:Protein tyrosine and serine/threonine kinase/Calx-beta domain
MKLGTGHEPNGILRDEKIFDPTQTQPLSWRMHQGQAMPWEDVPMEPSNRQSPSFDDSLPDRLSERGYRLRARLGSGRLGAIYEAQDELSRISGSKHFVAVQLIDDKIAARPGFAAEFERGAAELKSIAHPNIVRLLEHGSDSNRYYLVNELLESASLRFVLNDAGVLPMPETIAVLGAVGDALQYLHAKSMVHGNLRPENVLVTFGYEVKLLDIVPGGWLLGPNDALGVPARSPDKRDDVFGVACLAYEMLSGRHPFNGNSAQEAYRAGLEAAPIEGLTDRQWQALANALAVHRDDRTPSVAQLLEEFGVTRVQKLKAVVAAASAPPPPTYAAPDPPPALARPVVAERATPAPLRRSNVGALLLLLAVIGAGVAAWFYQEPIRQFATDLMSEVDVQMNRASVTPDRAPASAPAPAPLETAPTVTEDAPATVLAPGAKLPDATASSVPPSAAASSTTDEPVPTAAEKVAEATQPATAPPAAAAPTIAAPTAAAPTAAAPIATAPTAPPGPTRFDFTQPTVNVREGDVAARITIHRIGDLSKAAEVGWWTEGGTAVADVDYADLGARVERFAPGEASRTVYVPLTNDSVREPMKSFTMVLGRGAGDIVARTRVDIVDDD